jgi:methionyl-tRNA formyltransferase
MALRLVFMGTPDFAVPTLAAIVGGGHEVVAAYTRAPRPAGRGMALRPSPVEREARRLGIEVVTPPTLRTPQAQDSFRAHRANAAVVVAYGLILPAPILDAPPFGCFNLHASALPRWRGAAPINRAATVMKLEEGLDTGPVAMAERVAIGPDMTAGELHDRLALIGAGVMVRALAALERGALRLTPQTSDGVTYATKIDNSETRIDWAKPWKAVHDHCRGLSPHPGAWFVLPPAAWGAGGAGDAASAGGAGDAASAGGAGGAASAGSAAAVRIKVMRTTRGEGEGEPGTAIDGRLTIACGSGAVRILELQRAGRKPMTADEFLRGTAITPGTRLAPNGAFSSSDSAPAS